MPYSDEEVMRAILEDSDYIQHYGTKFHSGRYPYGSGENPYQHDPHTFLSQYASLQKKGDLTESQIAVTLLGKGATTSDLRAYKRIYDNAVTAEKIKTAQSYSKQGYGPTEIGRKMGASESTVRGWLKADVTKTAEVTRNTADAIEAACQKTGFVDIGEGSYLHLGVSKDTLKYATKMAELDGYIVEEIHVRQLNSPTNKTTIKVLIDPDRISEYSPDRGTAIDAAYKAQAAQKLESLAEFHSKDGGLSFQKTLPPASLSPNRVAVRYADTGLNGDTSVLGTEKDGVMEIRPSAYDLSLGNSQYAQVRIKVGDDHYLKGMAVYGREEDFPKGVDIIFNTNKTHDVPMCGENKDDTVLKKLKSDPDNPFGATIKPGGQSTYIGSDGKEHQSVVNKVNEEGDWGKWSKNLASQMLSKQNAALIDKQLTLAYNAKEAEFNEIMSLTNPYIKQQLLIDFGDGCDSAAVHMKGAAMPGQQSHVIIPEPTLKENEIYAPNYKNGERIALVRYPHGSISEIPILTVNNKNKNAENTIGKNSRDAVCINAAVAERLSGADFDGDTVLVIPDRKKEIQSAPQLKALVGFSTNEYAWPKGMEHKRVGADTTKGEDGFQKQMEMGKISNLITDMTMQNAEPDEIARALKHSMVVIDAEKHDLNWKQSEKDNNIADLKTKYQGGATAGASTIVSRATSDAVILPRKQGAYVVDEKTGAKKKVYIDPATGERLYTEQHENPYVNATRDGKKVRFNVVTDKTTGEMKLSYYDKDSKKLVEEPYRGQKINYKTQKSTKMAETKDPYSLIGTDNIKEQMYAEYATRLKSLANTARKEGMNQPAYHSEYQNKELKAQYSKEIASINAKINTNLKAKPLKRQADAIADARYQEWYKAQPTKPDGDECKKAKQRYIKEARAITGADRSTINITPDEWKAIEAGAISRNKLEQIWAGGDKDQLKQYAMPHDTKAYSPAIANRIQAMAGNGYTNAEIAEQCNVSASTVSRILNGEM